MSRAINAWNTLLPGTGVDLGKDVELRFDPRIASRHCISLEEILAEWREDIGSRHREFERSILNCPLPGHWNLLARLLLGVAKAERSHSGEGFTVQGTVPFETGVVVEQFRSARGRPGETTWGLGDELKVHYRVSAPVTGLCLSCSPVKFVVDSGVPYIEVFSFYPIQPVRNTAGPEFHRLFEDWEAPWVESNETPWRFIGTRLGDYATLTEASKTGGVHRRLSNWAWSTHGNQACPCVFAYRLRRGEICPYAVEWRRDRTWRSLRCGCTTKCQHLVPPFLP